MPLLRLVAEGVGPFDRVELDLSDGKGNPHLGPHILAGVNGSGKSTVLRAIAWVLDKGARGFPYDEWSHSTTGYDHSHVLLTASLSGGERIDLACTAGQNWHQRVSLWIGRLAEAGALTLSLEQEWKQFNHPRAEYKFVLRHVLTIKGQSHLAAHDRQVFSGSL